MDKSEFHCLLPTPASYPTLNYELYFKLVKVLRKIQNNAVHFTSLNSILCIFGTVIIADMNSYYSFARLYLANNF